MMFFGKDVTKMSQVEKKYFRVQERHIIPKNVTNITCHIFLSPKKVTNVTSLTQI